MGFCHIPASKLQEIKPLSKKLIDDLNFLDKNNKGLRKLVLPFTKKNKFEDIQIAYNFLKEYCRFEGVKEKMASIESYYPKEKLLDYKKEGKQPVHQSEYICMDENSLEIVFENSLKTI